MNSLQQKIQAVLFASGEPYEAAKLAQILQVDKRTLSGLVHSVNDGFEKSKSPFQILELGSSYQMTTKAEFGAIIKEALEVKRNTPLSQASLEVLAIIAYNQPVTKSFIEQVRGIDSGSIVNTLVAKELVTEAGRLELPGRPVAYQTTPNFLRCFGMSGIEALPKIPERVAIEE